MTSYQQRRVALRKRLGEKRILTIPGTGDALGAKLIEKNGFEAVYVSGYAVEGTFGFPDVGILGMSEMVDRAAQITDAVDLPVVCDVDNGYGGVISVIRTTREFERAGVSAIQLEDQQSPKRCGSMAGKSVIPTSEMVSKLKAALDTRQDENMLIIGRTDATALEGFNSAVDRLGVYAETGADLVLITGPFKESDIASLQQKFSKPLLYVNAETGTMPQIPAAKLEQYGIRATIYPLALVLAASRAIERTLQEIKRTGTTAHLLEDQTIETWAGFNNIVGLGQVKEWEDRYR